MVLKRDITGQLLCANRYWSPREVVSASSFAAHAWVLFAAICSGWPALSELSSSSLLVAVSVSLSCVSNEAGFLIEDSCVGGVFSVFTTLDVASAASCKAILEVGVGLFVGVVKQVHSTCLTLSLFIKFGLSFKPHFAQPFILSILLVSYILVLRTKYVRTGTRCGITLLVLHYYRST